MQEIKFTYLNECYSGICVTDDNGCTTYEVTSISIPEKKATLVINHIASFAVIYEDNVPCDAPDHRFYRDMSDYDIYVKLIKEFIL